MGKINLQLILQAFKQDELLSMIDSDTLNAIKEKDNHPLFQAYSFCHEGVSKPKIIGDGVTPISWTRKAIQSIKNIVLKGVKFFKGHNEDNSTNNRESVGEVVANKELEIDGKLHHIVVGYFPKKEEAKNFNICSQESVWNFIKEGGRIIADKIEELTGIAVSNSDNDKPAFEGAVRLAQVQCFMEEQEEKEYYIKAFEETNALRNKIFEEEKLLREKIRERI